MKITIKEIANQVGVSPSTISRAVNTETRNKVAPNTLRKIDKVVCKYGYTPNLAAKTLRKNTTRTIGVVFPYFSGIFLSPYYAYVLSGVADFLLTTDYQFKTLLLKGEQNRWDHYDFKSGERVDGLVVTHWFKFFSQKSILERMNVPCVIINDYDKNIKTHFVCVDHYLGGKIAANHLYSLGHRNMAVILGPSWSKDSQQRLEGFQSFLKGRGIRLNPDLVLRADYQEQIAYERVEQLLKKKIKFTAIFCCNDHMAFGVIRRLKELGISCPEDISVVGYDDAPQAAFFTPPLTTIHVPVYDLAKEAARSLLNHLKEGNPTKRFVGQTLLPVRLMGRNSVQKIS